MQPTSRRFQNYCDAEHDVGLVAENSSPSIAERNTERLNAALAGQWLGGQSRYLNGRVGPVLYPIQFAAKEFFFAGTIKTAALLGGAMIGGGGRSYPTISPYYTAGIHGGAVTRLTRIDGESGGAFVRYRGFGFLTENIQFNGRPYTYDATGEGPSTGTKTETGLEIEGRAAPASGGHVFRNCSMMDFIYGVRCRAGYYNDNNVFVADENHADNGILDGVTFWSCNSCFRSESQQAVVWKLRDCRVGYWGGSGFAPTVICDIERGGNLWIDGLDITTGTFTLFKVKDYTHNTQLLTCQNLKWDHVVGAQYYPCFFHYAGSAGEAGYKKWTVRISGHIAGSETDPDYDATKLIQVTPGTLNLPLNDILFDVARMPLDDFDTLGHWKYPTTAWL